MTALQAHADRYAVLSYHDVRDQVARDASTGQTAVSTEELRAQFQWLKDRGYQVVGFQEVLDARAGKRHLPDKAVVLSFDDGYASFYHKVFPLLQEFRYPAVIALVGAWMEGQSGDGDSPPRDQLLNWEQVKTLSRSPWVEVASHTHDLHRGILGNPQGNRQPAAVTRRYDAQTGRYESDQAYARRILTELKQSSDGIYRRIGKRPRILVWPYGESNAPLIAAAKAAGMPITLGLGDGHNDTAELSYVRRLLVAENPDIQDFARMMETERVADRPLHVVHADLDYLYDQDPARTEHNLGLFLDRIQAMGIKTVYLQAYADPDGDGNADALYFPNRHLPMRADLFNRVAWQLQTRARVKVYAWLPVLAFKARLPDDWYVKEWREGAARESSHSYRRLSPFNRQARQWVAEIYEDLAKHCNFSGLLFHDDAILSDYEDASPAALAYGKHHWSLPDTVAQLRATPAMRLRWARHKSDLLTEWTDFLAGKVRYFRPDIKTARNYYALPILNPDSEEWFAQSLDSGLKHYDYVAIEAMPFMEQAEHPEDWLRQLVGKVAAHPDGLRRTVFELQTVDWNTRQKIPMETLQGQIKLLQEAGAVHIGYYPDDPFQDQPSLEIMARDFALPRFP